MELYDLNEIKEKADCLDIARNVCGLEVVKGRCKATWRGGDNDQSIAINKDGWYDHARKEGGSVIDLVMKCRNMDIMEAAELLGDYLGLRKTQKVEMGNTKKVEGEYIYTNEEGIPVHKSTRVKYEDGSKDFYQHHFVDGKWEKGLNGCTTFPYKLTSWNDADYVHIHEGERKADAVLAWGINATSFVMGAGKWQAQWGKWFSGKDVVICRDNDDAGYSHGQRVAWELRTFAKSIKILKCSDEPKGDVIDFIEAGGTKEDYIALVENTPVTDPRTISEPQSSKTDSAIEKAKALNKYPFRNFFLTETCDDKGNSKFIPKPLIMNQIIKDLKERMLGFPKRIGEEIFDQDRDTKEIHHLRNAIALQSWISEKTRQPVEFKTGMGYVTIEQLHSALERQPERFDIISDCPHYPAVPGCYYSYGDLPKPCEDYAYLNKFCSFFSPADYVDSLLIKLCTVSMFYYQQAVDKPLWIIDTAEGNAQGTGKSKLVESMAWLRGEEPMLLDPSSIKNENLVERILKRILSMEGRNKRIFNVDNVDSYFNCEVFASFITQSTFSGLAPYGHGESTRVNDLSFFATCNGGRFGKDIVDRSVIIHLKKPTKPMDNWVIELRRFIKNHRYQIYSDICHMLSQKHNYDMPPQTRFRIWERDVVHKVMDDKEDLKLVLDTLRGRRVEADGETERIELLMECFKSKIAELGGNPDKGCFWIESQAITRICGEADPDFGGRGNVHAPRTINKYIKLGQCKWMDNKHKLWPTNTKKYIHKRGLMWNADAMPQNKEIKMLTFDGKNLYLKWPEEVRDV